MPTDPEQLRPLFEEIQRSLDTFEKGGDFPDHNERLKLISAAEKLAIAAREPEENLYYTATQTAQNAAIRSAIGLDIFALIPEDGSTVGVIEIAEKRGADRELVARILRACASTHIFDNPIPNHYSHNAASKVFLKDANRDMFQQMYDFAGKAVYSLPKFFELTKWRNPTDYNNSAFQLAHNTNLGFWEYLKENPERQRLFNSGMRSVATIGKDKKSAGPFPFDRLAIGSKPSEQLVVVDIGGGRGQMLEAIKEQYSSIAWKMVLQDLPDVIEDAREKGLPDFVEPQPASFFEPQKTHGARAYMFRRIFHDWSDEDSRRILFNTKSALAPESRILIFDTAVPNVQASRDLALQDLNMMSFAGMERTDQQWENLLKSVGLKVLNIWRSDATKHAVIEISLP